MPLPKAMAAESAFPANAGLGFSYTPPPGWIIQPMPPLNAPNPYPDCNAPNQDGFVPSIHVQSVTPAITLEEFIDNFLKSAAKASKDFKKIDQSNFATDSGLDGTRIIFETTGAGYPLRGYTYFFPGKTGLWVVSCYALRENGESTDQVLDAAMKTFTVE